MFVLLRIVVAVGALCAATTLTTESDLSRKWCDVVAQTFDFERRPEEREERALIEAHPVCVGSRVWSAGKMADTVYYRYRRDGDRLVVGYFVNWTTERPWGDNVLTYGVLPALFVDAFYSHTLFVLRGARDAIYGPSDVEGVSVTYQKDDEGQLVPVGGHAEDGVHDAVELERSDLDAGGRTALSTEVWSHQLGAKQAAEELRSRAAEESKCFSGAQLRPLPETVAEKFRLGSPEKPRRAKPAWRLESAP